MKIFFIIVALIGIVSCGRDNNKTAAAPQPPAQANPQPPGLQTAASPAPSADPRAGEIIPAREVSKELKSSIHEDAIISKTFHGESRDSMYKVDLNFDAKGQLTIAYAAGAVMYVTEAGVPYTFNTHLKFRKGSGPVPANARKFIVRDFVAFGAPNTPVAGRSILVARPKRDHHQTSTFAANLAADSKHVDSITVIPLPMKVRATGETQMAPPMTLLLK